MAIGRTSTKAGVLKVGLYARVSTHDQQTLPMQLSAMRAYAKRRGWQVALDMTTPGGRALAGMLAVFAEFERDILCDRVKAGIAEARKEGRSHRRPPSVQHHAPEISALFARGVSKRQIAARLKISRASVRRMLPSRRITSLAPRLRVRARRA